MAAKKAADAAQVQRAEDFGIVSQVQRDLKIVFLGAGSMFFAKLLVDVLNIPGAKKGRMAIVDIDKKRLSLAEKVGRNIIETMGAAWTLTATTDRRAVLEGADYVINCIEVSGVDAVRADNDIPAAYGVDQCIGDTVGPGGLFKALRTVPVFLDVLADVEALCPEACVLNYTNPMSIMCLAAARASEARVFGLCHSVQHTSHELAKYVQVPYPQLRWRCGGINHLAWFLELSAGGEDLYPLLLSRIDSDKVLYEKDIVRFDMMKHFGYFITESSGHLSEYLPYYRKRKDLLKRYARDGYLGGSSFYADHWPQWRIDCDEKRRRQVAGAEPINTDRSNEYASHIIQGIETNQPFVFYGTVPNDGLIDNLPMDGVVEVACVADAKGISPVRFGPLPPQCAGVCDWQMRMVDVAAWACLEKSRDLAAQALMLDPLTAAVCSPAEIKKMTEELFTAEADLLPGF
jgi:alpha-galactosidase